MSANDPIIVALGFAGYVSAAVYCSASGKPFWAAFFAFTPALVVIIGFMKLRGMM
jgi:hypothetical protein